MGSPGSLASSSLIGFIKLVFHSQGLGERWPSWLPVASPLLRDALNRTRTFLSLVQSALLSWPSISSVDFCDSANVP